MVAQAPAPEPKVERVATPLAVGEEAPDFDVPAVIGQEKTRVRLSDYRGVRNVLLAFYPLDWTPV